LVDGVPQGVPVVRISRQRRGVQHELAARSACVGGDNRDLDAELKDDLAAAFGAACAMRPGNRTLNVVDDEPVTWRKLLGFVAERAGAPPPQDNGPVVFPSQRVSNQRAKAALEWKPECPSYREGLELIGQ
jgi:nucleoside-diphosphate-sugar epimerase